MRNCPLEPEGPRSLQSVSREEQQLAGQAWFAPPISRFGFPRCQSQLSVAPLRYSVTRLSKKFFSLPRSIVSLIQGRGAQIHATTAAGIRMVRHTSWRLIELHASDTRKALHVADQQSLFSS